MHNVRRLHVIRRRMRIRSVVVVSIELHPRDVLLERGYRHRARKLLAPAPHKIQAFAQNRGKGVNVLVPRAIEVAEEKQVVILVIFLPLAVAQKRKPLARDNYPARKFNEGQVDQTLLQRLYVPQNEEKTAQNPSLPWLHGSDGIHRVDLAVDVAHLTSDVR